MSVGAMVSIPMNAYESYNFQMHRVWLLSKSISVAQISILMCYNSSSNEATMVQIMAIEGGSFEDILLDPPLALPLGMTRYTTWRERFS